MPDTATTSLRRDMGLWAAMSIVVGTVIGSGIFIVPKTMILQVGSPGMVLLVWVFGGLLTLAGALTYAELAAMMPEAGGEYVYLKRPMVPSAVSFMAGRRCGWPRAHRSPRWPPASISTSPTSSRRSDASWRGFRCRRAPAEPRWPSIGVPIVFSFDWLAVEPGSLLVIRAGQLFAMALIFGLGFINWLGVRQGAGVQVSATAAESRAARRHHRMRPVSRRGARGEFRNCGARARRSRRLFRRIGGGTMGL